MIEYRAMLWKSKKFEGSFKLAKGTIIYVREIEPNIWLGMYYEDKGAGHGFALKEDDFRLLTSGDCQIEEVVVMPDPPEPAEDAAKVRELHRRRIEARIKRHREEADNLQALIAEGVT